MAKDKTVAFPLVDERGRPRLNPMDRKPIHLEVPPAIAKKIQEALDVPICTGLAGEGKQERPVFRVCRQVASARLDEERHELIVVFHPDARKLVIEGVKSLG